MDNLTEAKVFLKQAVFQKLGKELARRYYLKGSFGVSVGRQLFQKTDDEPLRRFLGITEWEWLSRRNISILLFEQALKSSSLQWSLMDFVVFVTKKPLQLKSEVEEQENIRYANFITQLNQIDPLFSKILTVKQLTKWLEDSGETFKIFEVVSKALQQLPKEMTHLPFFAYQQTGDAHFFDENEMGGRLFLQILTVLSQETTNEQKLTLVEEKNSILNEFKLLKDH